jgi:hypothetical protein
VYFNYIVLLILVWGIKMSQVIGKPGKNISCVPDKLWRTEEPCKGKERVSNTTCALLFPV